MALVPFRVSGRAADQALEERLMQFGPHLVTIEQVKFICMALMHSYFFITAYLFIASLILLAPVAESH